MDKYAAFIWPAYIVTALAFAGMIGFSLNHARRWRKLYEARVGKEPPAK